MKLSTRNITQNTRVFKWRAWTDSCSNLWFVCSILPSIQFWSVVSKLITISSTWNRTWLWTAPSMNLICKCDRKIFTPNSLATRLFTLTRTASRIRTTILGSLSHGKQHTAFDLCYCFTIDLWCTQMYRKRSGWCSSSQSQPNGASNGICTPCTHTSISSAKSSRGRLASAVTEYSTLASLSRGSSTRRTASPNVIPLVSPFSSRQAVDIGREVHTTCSHESTLLRVRCAISWPVRWCSSMGSTSEVVSKCTK